MFKRIISPIMIIQCALALTACTFGQSPATATSVPSSPRPVTKIPTASATPTPLGPTGLKGNWTLTFSDEFDSSTLNEVWSTCYWWDNEGCTISSNNELEWYRPENVSVKDGLLILEAREQEVTASDGKTYAYTSGMVSTGRATSDRTTSPGFAFRYGFAEIRAKVPSGQGIWPAFWMLPITHESRPEIDILEILGHAPNHIEMNYHFIGEDGKKTRSGGEWLGPDFSQDWHTFGVEWTPDRITWYIDGVARFEVADPAYISSEPMYIILNLAVGGNWPGSPDSTTVFPSRYEIDYVRVFERPNTAYLFPTRDTYVDASAPGENFGSGETTYSDGDPVKVSLLAYDTTALAGKKLLSAYLRIQTIEDDGAPSEDQHVISLLQPFTWEESALTFTHFIPQAIDTIGTIDNATWVNNVYQFPLDTGPLQPVIGSDFTLSITSKGTDGLYLFTRESLRGGPQLILTFLEE